MSPGEFRCERIIARRVGDCGSGSMRLCFSVQIRIGIPYSAISRRHGPPAAGGLTPLQKRARLWLRVHLIATAAAGPIATLAGAGGIPTGFARDALRWAAEQIQS